MGLLPAFFGALKHFLPTFCCFGQKGRSGYQGWIAPGLTAKKDDWCRNHLPIYTGGAELTEYGHRAPVETTHFTNLTYCFVNQGALHSPWKPLTNLFFNRQKKAGQKRALFEK